MNNKLFREMSFVLLLVIILILSACGTLEIDTEPTVSLGEAAVPATETPQALPTIEEVVVAAPTSEPSGEEVVPSIEVTPTATEPPAEDEDQAETDQPVSKPSEITMLDETWFNYTNYQLGFSINYPRTKIHFKGSCILNDENAYHTYRFEPAVVPVKIFEDENTVYITSEYQHELSGETTETEADGDSRTFFSDCQEVSNSLELLRDPDYYQEMWEIVVRDVQDDEELDAFLKSRYGSGCSLGEKVVSGQDSVFDVRILGDGMGLEETLCPLNFGTVVKYYPEARKVAAWDTGQAYTFSADVTNSVTYDQEMVDSFVFLTETSTESTADIEETGAADTGGFDYTGWLPYTNEELGYSLMYPGNADIMGGYPDESVEFVGPLVENEHWPWFYVEHHDSQFFHPPDGIDVRQWILDSNIPTEPLEQELTIGGLPAVQVSFEASPQAYGWDEFYVNKNGQLIRIKILHAGGLQDWGLYEQFLQSISFEPA